MAASELPPKKEIDVGADVSEYSEEIFNNLFKKEILYKANPKCWNSQPELNIYMRMIAISWLSEVATSFKLMPESLQSAISMVDRFISLYIVGKDNLQLVIIAALFIASKMEEIFPPSLSSFVYVSADTYTDKQIRDMEQAIINGLEFKLRGPLPIDFLRRFSSVANFDYHRHNMSKYIIELCQTDYQSISLLPSQLAAGVVYFVKFITRDVEDGDIWPDGMVYYTHYYESQANMYAHLVQQMLNRVVEYPKNLSLMRKYRTGGLEKIGKERYKLPVLYEYKEYQALEQEIPFVPGLRKIEPPPEYPPSEWD